MNNLININNGIPTANSREIAEHFEKQHYHVMEKIVDLSTRMDSPQKSGQYFIPSEYRDASGKANKEYLLTRDGFSLLVMGFTGEKALTWKLKYIDAFNRMEEEIKSNFAQLSPQLQLLINIETEQRNQAKALADTNARMDGALEIIALSTQSWRQDAKSLINKVALKMGGYDYLRDIQGEIYKLLDERFGVSLKTRLTFKRQRMADEGVCKSRRDKLTRVDIIAEDKKLIEGYVAIVKEMAVKYGVGDAAPGGSPSKERRHSMKRILGFSRNRFGWSWQTDIVNKIVRRAYNTFSVQYFANKRMLRISLPNCRTHDFEF